MPISALAYISYLLYPNYQCAKHTAVIYALKEMFSSHQDLTLEVGSPCSLIVDIIDICGGSIGDCSQNSIRRCQCY